METYIRLMFEIQWKPKAIRQLEKIKDKFIREKNL